MSLEMKFTVEDEFLHIHLKADNSYETSTRLWKEIYDLCSKYHLKKILVISDSEPLDTLPAYDHSKLIKEVGFTFQYRVAWVEKNPETFQVDKFIETILLNRGIIQAKLFPEESEAKRWLLNKLCNIMLDRKTIQRSHNIVYMKRLLHSSIETVPVISQKICHCF